MKIQGPNWDDIDRFERDRRRRYLKWAKAATRKPQRYLFARGLDVYVASRLENIDNVKKLCAMLEAEGHRITYKWCTHGRVWSPERKPEDNRARMCKVAHDESNGVLNADVVILLLPGGRGTHVELGVALAAQKPIILCSETPLIEEIKPFQKGKLAGPCAFYFHQRCEHLIEPDPELRLYRAVDTVRWMTVEIRKRRWAERMERDNTAPRGLADISLAGVARDGAHILNTFFTPREEEYA